MSQKVRKCISLKIYNPLTLYIIPHSLSVLSCLPCPQTLRFTLISRRTCRQTYETAVFGQDLPTER